MRIGLYSIAILFVLATSANADNVQILLKHFYLGNQAWVINQKCEFLTRDEQTDFYINLDTYNSFIKFGMQQAYGQIVSTEHKAKLSGEMAHERFGCDSTNRAAVDEAYKNLKELNRIFNIRHDNVPRIKHKQTH